MKIKRALISVSDKSNLKELVLALSRKQIEIISTGGTAKTIKEWGIDVKSVSDLTGYPEIFGGRVKTLHPVIEGGILFRRNQKSDVEELEKLGIPQIDLVVCNLYPFEDTLKKQNKTFEDLIENIDIGGPTMIRAAAKNFTDVIVITDTKDYQNIIDKIEADNEFTYEERKKYAAKAFSLTSYYDSLIFNTINPELFSHEHITLPLKKTMSLRYGENPNQKAYYYSNSTFPNPLPHRLLHGKELSYNNLNDIFTSIEIMKDFEQPTAVIIKHCNPCGLAIGKDIEEAFEKARSSDPLSAFGGIICLNRKVNKNLAKKINDFFNECLVAPEYDSDALEILKKKKNRRILLLEENNPIYKTQFSDIGNGFLLQNRDIDYPELEDLELMAGQELSGNDMEDLYFAWKAAKFVKSNAIVIVKDGMLIGVGAGQMSRVDSVKIAFRKCEENGHNPKGGILASDAYFPFRDNIDYCAVYQLKAIIQPGGSVRDEEVIKASQDHNITMYLTKTRHFKH